MKKNKLYIDTITTMNGHCEESCVAERRSNLSLLSRLLRQKTARNNKVFLFFRFFLILILSIYVMSCGPKEIEPVDLFPEDECARCRMAISDPAFASQIINKDGSVVKFDDLRCFESYRKERNVDDVEKMYVKDYETKEWISFWKSIVIQTGIQTPMGSGQIAVADQQRAKQLLEQYPPKRKAVKDDACCSPTKD